MHVCYPRQDRRLGGGVKEEGEGEAGQDLGPGRPGRPRSSCSLQQVRRTRARSLWLSRHLLAGAGSPERPPPQGPLRGAPEAAFSGLSLCQQLSAASGSSGARRGRSGRLLPSAPARGLLPHPAPSSPWIGTAQADSGRRAGSSAPSVPVQHHGRRGQSSPLQAALPASAPRRRTAPASRPSPKPRGWGLGCSLGVGRSRQMGDFGYSRSGGSVARASWRRGPSHSRASPAWVCSSPRPGSAMAGLSRESRKRVGGETGTEESLAPGGRVGPSLGWEGGVLCPLSSRSLALAQDHGLGRD